MANAVFCFQFKSSQQSVLVRPYNENKGQSSSYISRDMFK